MSDGDGWMTAGAPASLADEAGRFSSMTCSEQVEYVWNVVRLAALDGDESVAASALVPLRLIHERVSEMESELSRRSAEAVQSHQERTE